MYRTINMNAFRTFEHLHVAANGGIDIVSAKTLVAPGTLSDSLNYEVASEPGYKLCDGVLQYVGKGFGVPKRYLRAQVASSSGGNDFVIGGIYPLGIVGVVNVDVIAKVIYLGSRPEGFLEVPYAYFVVIEGDLSASKEAFSGNTMIFIPNPPVLVE